MKTENRIFKYDNVKFVLILLVLIGHMVDQYIDKTGLFKSIFIFVYSFHAPLFIFINGLFQRRIKKEHRFNWHKFVFYVFVSYLLRIIIYIIKSIDHTGAKINWFGGAELSCFLTVLAIYLAIVFILSRIKIHPAVVIVISIIVAGVCGYIPYIKNFLWLSRVFVFLPFYLAGYYLTPQKILKFTGKVYVKIPAIILGLGWALLCLWKRNMVYPLRGLFTGQSPYASVGIEGCGIIHRYICYVIMAVMCIAVLSAIPNIKIPVVTRMGANTLAAFFWHRPIIYVLEYTGALAAISNLPKNACIAVTLVIAVVMGLILMIDVVSFPAKKLRAFLNRRSGKACMLLFIVIIVFGIAFTIQEGIKL